MNKLIILVFIFLPFNLYGFYEDEYGEDYHEYLEPVKVPKTSISWNIFGLTEEKSKCIIDDEGYDYCFKEPIYNKKVKKLENKIIEVTGYMFPLEPSQKQKEFLVGPYPLTCPFHYHSKPNETLYVTSKKGIDFSYEPITIKGRLSLDFDPDLGSFYYLTIDD